MEPLRLMTRTLLIPISRLKIVPLCASNGELVDFIKDERFVVTVFQELLHRYYNAVPLSGSLNCPGVEGSTSALIAEYLKKRGIDVGKGQVYVEQNDLVNYQKELGYQVRKILSQYGLYSCTCKFEELRMLDHGFTTELKVCRGKGFVQFTWWVPSLFYKRMTVEQLLSRALNTDDNSPRYREATLSNLFTSGKNTTWDELVKNVLIIGE
ncbi:hypothetical protein IS230_004735 [Salmonella enterica]|nr:hypothetical protein [Salmonella enterica]